MMMVDSMKPIVKSINIGARKNTDVVLVRDSMPLGLIQMDGFIEILPNDKFFLTVAAENYHAYALFFVEPDDKFAAVSLYQTSRDYAYRALNQNVSFENAANGSLEDFSKSLRDFEKEDVPALYWAVASSLAWMRLSRESRFDSVVEFPKLEAMMDRILILDETYNYGAIHALMGAYYSSIPESLGGNSEDAQYHFDEAFEISEFKFLLWQVFYAKYFAFHSRNKSLYVETLENVLSSPDDIFPEETFSNRMAREIAEKMLKDTNTIF
jgi:hypothetical protein